MRLDAYLAQQHPELSRSQLQQYIKAGRVLVNGSIISKASFLVGDSDVIKFNKPDVANYDLEIKQFAKRVVYCDENVVVINKPAGLLVHAKGGIGHEFTVADYARSQFSPDELAVNDSNNRLGIVHRLDRATSGVMICARNLATAHMLSRQFAERKTHKTYLAVTDGIPGEKCARINLPIGRNLSRPSTFRVDGKGKPAVTDYRVLRIYDDGKALLELKPLTGRTHQLRIHLAYLGCPIVGDPVYGQGKYGDRLMLHAWKLEITIPGCPTNNRQIFVADPPAEFGLSPELLGND